MTAQHLRQAVAALMLGSAAVTGAAQAGERPPMPNVGLGGETKGAAAVRALGRDLPAVAAHYRMSPERLQEILTKDGTSRLDRGGRLFFVEQPASTAPSTPPIAQTYVTDLTQTFLLNSKPGASKLLYLDFDGYSTSGSAWNGGAAITAQPYDTDGIPGSFSDAEKTAITNIWRRVAEDYATFDVNVTTQDPGAAAIQRASSTDQNFGTRVVITKNTFYNCSCGGVAYVGTYDYASASNPDYYQPAWVFFDALGNGNEKYVAEAASHEAGHNLGLSHDGRSNPVEGYYAGHGSGETGWAPIMGVGYSKNLTQWSKGEYPYADNQEDDFVVIGQNGLAVRADDAGDSVATATAVRGTSVNGSFNALTYGLINNTADVDVYAFVAGAGTASFLVSGAPLGPNEDLRADILDASGNVLASANPVDLLAASVSANLAAGTYYLRIEGVGKGDLSTGYSDYGSVGQYKITGSFTDSGALAPVADFTATPATGTTPLFVSFNAGGSTDADGSITSYAWNFGDGSTGTGITTSRTYSSAGSFTVTLTVTDNTGLTATKTTVITANAPPASSMSVKSVSVLATSSKSGYRCIASVAVQNDATLGAVSSASVSGSWSGTVTGTVAGTTGSNGVATISSGNTKRRGTCTYTVNSVTATGYVYANPATKPSGSVNY